MKPAIKILFYSLLLFINTAIFTMPAFSSSYFPGADSLNILHYDIHLDIMNFSAKQINGFTEVKLTPKVNNISKINLNLFKLNVDSVFINNVKSHLFLYNDTLLQIPLANAISPNDTVNVRIYYHGKPQLDPSLGNWGGFFFSGNYAFNLGVGMKSNPHPIGRFWFPCIDDFKSRALYDFYIRTENTHTAVCNGELVNIENKEDNTRIFHWKMNNTIPSYLVSVAVSDYAALKDTFKGIKGIIPLSIYVNPADTVKAKASFINIKYILGIFEKDFGPYLWQRVGYVGVPFLYGAMEHATNIAYPNSMIDGSLNYESLYAHELSHHWFGDLVTCASAEDMWINEGWAAFCEYVYREGLYGKQSYKDNLRDNHRYVLQSLYILDKGYRAIQGNPPDYTYCKTVYDKGADVVHTLRNYMGDTLFFKTTKEYLKQFAFNNISTPQLRDYFTEKSGIKLNDFFDTWVYGKGFPHFSVDSFNLKSKSNDSKSFNVEVFVRQRLRGASSFGKSNKLEITFMSAGWKSLTDTIVFSGEFASRVFSVPFKPDIVMADIEEKVSDATTDNYIVIKNKSDYIFPQTYFALTVNDIKDSAFVRVEHNWVAPDKFKKPLKDVKRISDARYWKIDGIFPEGFNAKGKFYFSKSADINNGNLDNNFLRYNKSADSLILLYRANCADDWKVVNYSVSGNGYYGNVYSDNIKPGEYCLGIGKRGVSVDEHRSAENNNLSIYPNPSEGKFKIEYDINDEGQINIYDISGSLLDSINVSRGYNIISWNSDKLKAGIYIFKLFTNNNKIIITKSVVKH